VPHREREVGLGPLIRPFGFHLAVSHPAVRSLHRGPPTRLLVYDGATSPRRSRSPRTPFPANVRVDDPIQACDFFLSSHWGGEILFSETTQNPWNPVNQIAPVPRDAEGIELKLSVSSDEGVVKKVKRSPAGYELSVLQSRQTRLHVL
jgi:hypothetical protein